MTDNGSLSSLHRIALVDDNPFDNRFHSIVLRKAGFAGEVLVFESGEQALELLLADAAPEIDLLLLDINLPGINGFQVAEALANKGGRLPSLVVVMLTSSPDPGDVERARSIPIVRDYVTKPLRAENLTDIVTALLNSP